VEGIEKKWRMGFGFELSLKIVFIVVILWLTVFEWQAVLLRFLIEQFPAVGDSSWTHLLIAVILTGVTLAILYTYDIAGADVYGIAGFCKGARGGATY